MFLLALAAYVTPVADLDGTAQQSTMAVSDIKRGGMLAAGTPHDPIAIDGDANFSATALLEGWPGDGSEGIRNGSRSIWIAYLRELIPEDGSINKMSGFQWSRSIVLNPGSQDEKYELTPKLERHHISFIEDHGRFDRKRGYIHLQLSRYLNTEDGLKEDIVKSIESLIADNRCRLLDDETSLAENLGIKMRVYPESITVYQKTGRVSIKWVATTQSVEDTIRWYLIAPPNDVRKNGKARLLMSHRPERVERIKKQIQSEGLL